MTMIEWAGFEAVALESEAVRVVIIPALGSKIVSLYDRATATEWLAPPTRPLRRAPYAAPFTGYDLSGWDEMFPTINVCAVPGDAAGQLPDHGEVWALPWERIGDTDNALTARVQGQQAAYRYQLTRKAALNGDTLRLEYLLENKGPHDLPFLWAAHPLFIGTPDTRIRLPEAVRRVVNAADHPQMGPPDREIDWPTAALLNGEAQALDRVGDAARQDYRKVYTLPDQAVGTGALIREDGGQSLTMRWDTSVAPYLGVWVDEGTYTRTTTVALEPASGYYDSLSLAVVNGRAAVVKAGGTRTWWLDVTLGQA